MSPQAFIETVNKAPHKTIADSFDSFKALLQSINVSALIRGELRGWQADYTKPPRLLSKGRLTLIAGEWFTVELECVERYVTSESLVSQRSDRIIYALEAVKYDCYSLHGLHTESSDPSTVGAALKFVGDALVGQYILIESRETAVRFHAPVLALVFSDRRLNPYSWVFDCLSGKYLAHHNNFPSLTSLELIAIFLGDYGTTRDLEGLEILLSSSSDNVKWQAARAISKIDPSAGLQAFEQLANSTSSHLSKAARQIITRVTREVQT